MSVALEVGGPLSHVRALLFDTFGTVVDWREGIARDVTRFLARYRLKRDAREFADAWRARYQPSMELIRRGDRPFTRLDTLHRENLEAVLLSGGANLAEIDPIDLDDLNHAWHRLDPWPDTIAGLSRLRERYVIAPLSNGNIALLTNMAKRAGLPWDCILGAEVVQAYKPERDAYLKTADVLGLLPHQCMMVAAHNDDLRAAHAANLRTAFVLRGTEHGLAQTTDLSAEGPWDIVASDFNGLADALTPRDSR